VYWLGQVLVHKEVFEAFVVCKMDVWCRFEDVKVFVGDHILARRMAGVEEVEEEDGLDEKLLVDLPV
jgi:SUMO ligase MMS21 Smc5/6 complex component